MNFDDSPAEAAFRALAREWIAANAPQYLHAGLLAAAAQTLSSGHPLEIDGEDPVAISKAWQEHKAAAGWACLHRPAQYGGRGAPPIHCDLETTEGRPVDGVAVRARLATWLARQRGLQWTMMRTISALSGGKPPGPENSIGKLGAGEIAQDLCAYALDLQGPAGATLEEHSATRSFQKMLLSSASIRVGGGTAEIQRNIIAEQVLGLPADPRADKGLPFNKIPMGRA